MKHKILITCFTFPPNMDGVAEAARSMAFGLADRGFDVIVATGALPARKDFHPHPHVRVEQFDVISNWKFEGRSQEEAERMKRLIVDESPDVIICHCWEIWSTALAEQVYQQLPKTKKILVSHGYTTHLWRPNPRPPFGLGVLSRSLPLILGLPKTLRRYDRVTFLSAKRDWNRFFDHWVAKLTGYKGIRVIPNGTDPAPARGSVEDFRSKYGLGQGLNLLCVANYGPRKNQELAIRAFRKARLKDSTLVLIGSEFNDYVRKIKLIDEQLQTDYPEGRVVFIEKLDRLSTMASYAACDVFLLAATAETQPISLLEAMAAGMAFISTDTGCVSEMPGGVIANSEDELAAAIVSLEDDTKRNALGAEGRQAVLDYFSKEKVLDAQERMIRELLDADRGV